jgi:hypothetical protein
MKKNKKIILIITGSIAIFVVVAFLLLQPLAPYLIRKYSREYTGRQITTDRFFLNPISGIINLHNIKIYEFESDSIFFSAEDISARIPILKLLVNKPEIKSLVFNHPRGIVIKQDKDANFDDLVSRFSSAEDSLVKDTSQIKNQISILNVRIIDGEFYYREPTTPIDYFVKKVNIESSGKRWDSDTVNLKFSFLPGTGGGNVRGDLTMNLKDYNYRIALVAEKFDLGIIGQSLKALTNYGRFSANIDADIKASGNILDQGAISTSGQIAINDFHFGKDRGDDFASFDKLSLSIIRVSPREHIYTYDSVSLLRPYIKYEKYDYLDNIQRVFGENGSNIESANNNEKFNLIISIARYIKELSVNFFSSYYKIHRFRIYSGQIKFIDYSASEKFSLELNPITVRADSIDRERNKVNLSLKSPIRPFGNLSFAISANPKDSTDFDFEYHLNKLSVPMFNPYSITFTSFPLDRGTLEFNGKWRVRNGIINSLNHLVIIDPRTTKRIRNKDTKWVPLPLIMSFVRERGNVIDYQIPVTGDLKDPTFHLKNVFTDLLRNIFVKPPTTPYRLQVNNIEKKIEKSISFKWQMRQSELSGDQKKFAGKISDFLAKNPDAEITVNPNQYADKEKEYILYYEAKKKFFRSVNKKETLSAEDEEKIDHMSVKDSAFVNYLNHHLKDSLIFTIQEKCYNTIDTPRVNEIFNKLISDRKKNFIAIFEEKKTDKRVKFSKDDIVTPFDGFSFYEIDYSGKFPESLYKAYQELNELNSEAPRKKFRKERSLTFVKAE